MSKYTIDDFIKKAKSIHGDKYDYSKVEYINGYTKVCIICPIHGEFWKTPDNHIHKTFPQGCVECSKKNQYIQTISERKENFLRKAREIHGDKYDYSKVEYKNNSTKVCIICPIHGEFWQTPAGHTSGRGCEKCSNAQVQQKLQLGKEDFIKKAKHTHGDKYNYSKVEYINNRTKVCIICPQHGEFWQSPDHHMGGNGCPKCAGKQLTNEEIITIFNQKHNNKYDYSKVEYQHSEKQVCIICPIHGEFWQTPREHKNGNGCPKCGIEKLKQMFTKSQETFIQEAQAVHGNKYDYSKVEYINTETKVCIICPQHGEFWQKPALHLKGTNCPRCQITHLEEETYNILKGNQINFETYKNFTWLGRQSLDFYLPQHNIAIECQGRQHFEEVKSFGGEEGFAKTQERDKRKYDLCKANGIKLLYFTHEDYDTFLGEELIKDSSKLIEKILA